MMRKWLITRAAVRNDRSALYLFNDDMTRTITSGTAAICYGEPNALGVRVRPTPATLWTDADREAAIPAIDADLDEAIKWLVDDPRRRVVIPAQGLGIDALRYAPTIFHHLYYRLVEMERDYGVHQLHVDLLFESTHDGLAIPIRRLLVVPTGDNIASFG
jgi:hypothetical protein